MTGKTELSTSQILKYTHALPRHRRQKLDTSAYRQVHRRLTEIGAVKVRRVPPYGAWLWRLREGK
jgi:hypothetical protein